MRAKLTRPAVLAVLAIGAALSLSACGGPDGVRTERMRLEERFASTYGVNGTEGASAERAAAAAASPAPAVADAPAPADAAEMAAETGAAATDAAGGVADSSREDLSAALAAAGSEVEEPAAGGTGDEEPVVSAPKSIPSAAAPDGSGRQDLRASGDEETREAPAAEGKDVASAMKSLRLDVSARREEAKFNARKGDESYGKARYEEALAAYDRALELDPTLEDARKRRNNAALMLGERSHEAEGVLPFLQGEVLVVREQRAKEIDYNLAKAKQALDAGSVDEAERLAVLAADLVKLDIDLVGRAKAQDVKAFLEGVRATQAAREEESRRQKFADAGQRAQDELDVQDKVRKGQVQTLLRKALLASRRGEHKKVLGLCQTILDFDPDNQVAAFWKRAAEERLLKERQLRVLEDRNENRRLLEVGFLEGRNPLAGSFKFPDPEEWDLVRRRQSAMSETSTFDDPEPVQRIRRQLEGTQMTVTFEDTSLKEVIDHFRRVAGINILLDPSISAEDAQFNVTQPITNLSAMSALTLILRSKGLGFTFEENTLVITSKAQAKEEVVFDVYTVHDLLMKVRDFSAPEIRLKSATEDTSAAPISFTGSAEEEDEALDPEKLIELLRNSTGGEAEWGEGNTMEAHKGQILVNASRFLHRRVQDVLTSLRQDSDLFVVIEARFIEITDDFLEDIGVDSRALGASNNLGTPFGGVINDSSTGGNDIGFVEQGNVDDVQLVSGLDRWAGRVQHIIDGFTGTISGRRLSASQGVGGATFQATWLEPFQINTILRLVQEEQEARQLTAPVVTAHNNERVYVSVITQRAYIADYELVSGGTGFAIIEVADPIVQTFQEGVILDVDPTISHDKKYVTMDVRPTLATLIGGTISTIEISLGSFTNVAFMVPIGVPEIALQQSFTSVTVPNGGTVLLGGFKSLDEGTFTSYLPILGQIPIVKNLVRRKATISERRSLVILLTANIVDLRGEEAVAFNPQ